MVSLLKDIETDVDARHTKAFDPLGLKEDLTLDSEGWHKSRSAGEHHRYNPQTIHLLQQSTWTGNYEMFKQYTELVNQEETGYIRSIMDFNYPEHGVPLDEVESVDSIVRRFKTGAMSYGSISQEAHETLAIAMNMLHGKSNTGEGGEESRPSGDRTGRKEPLLSNQTGCVWPIRRYFKISGKCKRDPDQDGTGCKAGRGRSSSGQEGVSVDCKDETFDTRREPDLPAAAS